MLICPNNNKVKSYCEYLTNTYISEENIFPPTIWASDSSDLSKTNARESYHSYFFNNVFTKTYLKTSIQSYIGNE